MRGKKEIKKQIRPTGGGRCGDTEAVRTEHNRIGGTTSYNHKGAPANSVKSIVKV